MAKTASGLMYAQNSFLVYFYEIFMLNKYQIMTIVKKVFSAYIIPKSGTFLWHDFSAYIKDFSVYIKSTFRYTSTWQWYLFAAFKDIIRKHLKMISLWKLKFIHITNESSDKAKEYILYVYKWRIHWIWINTFTIRLLNDGVWKTDTFEVRVLHPKRLKNTRSTITIF